MTHSFNRRNFIKSTAIGVIGAMAIPDIVSAAGGSPHSKKITLSENDVIVFQGDSITDAGRNKTDVTPNSFQMLGSGYVFHAAADLLLNHPTKNLKIYNKGISGNKVFQLADRWDADCLVYKPTVLSILVGVNDFWHTLDGHGYKGTIETYTTDYRKLLERTKSALPNVKLIIGEPFGVKGIKSVNETWYPAFDSYRKAAQDLAIEFDAAFIPYQSIIDKALQSAEGSYWTADGVHPTIAGAKLMANAWMKLVK